MLRVASVSGVCSVMKSARSSSSSSSTFSTPSSSARFSPRNGSNAITRILSPSARSATIEPILPQPIRPSVLAVSSTPMKRFFSHFAGFGRSAGLGNLPRQREHHGDGVLGGGDGVAVRRVHHHDAARGGRFEIDVVDADAGAADHLEIGRRVQQLLRHLGGGAHRQPVVRRDDRAQIGRRKAGLHVDLDAAPAEYFHCGGRELVADKDFDHRAYSAARAGANSRATASNAQSSQGSSATISAVSTVAPPQMRKPGGASR